ncbi:DEAD-box helicase Dbp80-like [Topomyia yanbarensis]|uniref:DEAD-box helicase Dbp80-like n=1 Tax=Topomyia yanbarensis TaxID=2498891 RepID=UPI00273BEB77|nr:DEAD-box helicase Dbp80-like [Topomyia yanbarensis]
MGETDHIIIGTPVNLMGGSINFRVFDCRFCTGRRGRHDRYSGPPGSVHPDTQAAVVVLPNYVLGHVRAGGDGVRRVTNPIVFRLVREQESLNNIKQYYVKCRNQDKKYQAISNIYGVITVGQSIILCHVMYRTVVSSK